MSIPTHNDIGAYVKAQIGISPKNASAGATNGAAIDRQNFGSCALHVAAGAATGSPTAQTVDAKLQESADGSTGWTDITGAAITQIAADNGEAEKDVDLSSTKRYVRAVVTVSFTGGTAPAIPVAATAVFGGGNTLPV